VVFDDCFSDKEIIMTRTNFDPKEHGFAFKNWWNFDAAEKKRLHETFAKYLDKSVIIRTAALGPLWSLPITMSVRAMRKKMEEHLTPTFGLCGGMSFTALDYYKVDRKPPKMPDPPAPGTELRSYIWKRQIDSLIGDGITFLTWVIALKYLSRLSFWQGCTWARNRSEKEWKRLTTSVEQGKPIPIGLIRDTENVFDDHQVLAIGYEGTFVNNGKIFLYDPNCPGKESTICLKVSDHMLIGEESCGESSNLRGFFCEDHKFFNLPGII
jgi:hypothetical protein